VQPDRYRTLLRCTEGSIFDWSNPHPSHIWAPFQISCILHPPGIATRPFSYRRPRSFFSLPPQPKGSAVQKPFLLHRRQSLIASQEASLSQAGPRFPLSHLRAHEGVSATVETTTSATMSKASKRESPASAPFLLKSHDPAFAAGFLACLSLLSADPPRISRAFDLARGITTAHSVPRVASAVPKK
jgi:hypothetical protein